MKPGKITLWPAPKEDVRHGLLVVFDRDTSTEREFAFADINKGQTDYELPSDIRTIKGVYKKIQ